MKKLLGILAISALTASAFAQGTIAIGNTASELVQQWTAVGNPALISVPTGQGHVEFLAAPAGTSLAAIGQLTSGGFAANYSSLAGFFAANPLWNGYTINNTVAPGRIVGTTVTVSPLAAGGSINYITIGWTGDYASYDLAYAAAAGNSALSFFGQSTMLTSATGNPTTPIPGTPTPMNGTYTGIVLAPLVPEPATFALAGLGLAALLVFRRRS
jgi:hypothetical protein